MKERKPELKRIDVNQQVFESLLEVWEPYVKFVPSIDPYRKGYKGTDIDNKNIIAYDGNQYMVIKECYLYAVIDEYESVDNTWKQVVIRCDNHLEKPYEGSISGIRAWSFMMKLLKKYYTEDEIKECLHSHEAEYNEELSQKHFIIEDTNVLRVYPTCLKYDINGAHCDAIREIFPKAADEIVELYNKRKEMPVYKAYINYFVGFLCRRGYKKTYNWIVQRTTRKLNDGIARCGDNAVLIYANTDGFIVWCPDEPCGPRHSKELGDFKLEYAGEVRFYRNFTISDASWFAYEIDSRDKNKRITGNVRLSVRDQIDLKNKKIVKYKRTRHYLNKEDYIYLTTDIKEVNLND